MPTGSQTSRPIGVLIVEDRPVARHVLETELAETEDIRVVGHAKDGRAAIDQVRALDPDVVLMDVVMPGMDGITALHEIRKFSDVPIIILSGSPEHAATMEQVARRRGADAFFVKPSGPVSVDLYRIRAGLLQTIRDVVKARRT